MATRWGICGTGFICNEFCAVLKSRPSEQHQIVAVAARELKRAMAFAEKFEIPKAFGSYQELVKDSNVDVVYIGTIHQTHKSISLLCLNAGKPVLCEKPMCLTIDEVREVHKVAKEKNIFFMEGIWSRCFPIYDEINKELDSGTLGNPFLVMATFTIPVLDVGEVRDGGGLIPSLGCYVVQAASLVFKDMPEKITVEGTLTENGADLGACIILRYRGNRMATLVYYSQAAAENNEIPFCEKMRNLPNSFTIIGTKGFIQVDPPFWCPTRMTGPSGVKEFPLPKTNHPLNLPNSEGFCYEADCVRDCLQKGLKECPKLTHADCEGIHSVLSEICKQLGVDYSGVSKQV